MKRILAIKTVDRVGSEVKLAGWVHSCRDHGQLIFIDLRDRSGIIQLVIPSQNQICRQLAESVRPEWVVEVIGKVNMRPDSMVNERMPTGAVEIEVTGLKVLNESKTPPFEISEDGAKVREDIRLKYRYLDLRRQKLKNNIILRHKIILLMRTFLNRYGFLEIETPILTKSTPEGARDFLVPSRIHPGEFYALPQSPQQYKQLLMIGGLEKYFQIARCFRDEDVRGNRQPEFTQLDVEASFVTQGYILNLIEKLYLEIIQKLVIWDRSLSKKLTFNPFLRLDYHEAMQKYGTDKPDLRKNKNDPDELAFAWIVNWPLFELDKENNRYDPCHHIFTAPRDEDLPLLDSDPLKVRSWQHDLVLNGEEVAGGSLRIHRRDVQEKIFKLVGLSKEEIEKKFGHFLRAFDYGVPPHGGIASGLGRFLMVLMNEQSIRDVMAFPKTGDACDLMMEAPSTVGSDQLKELNIKTTT